MSALPLISHRLFVAAVGNAAGPRSRPARDGAALHGAGRRPSAIHLQVLDATEPIPAGVARPLQVSLATGGT